MIHKKDKPNKQRLMEINDIKETLIDLVNQPLSITIKTQGSTPYVITYILGDFYREKRR